MPFSAVTHWENTEGVANNHFAAINLWATCKTVDSGSSISASSSMPNTPTLGSTGKARWYSVLVVLKMAIRYLWSLGHVYDGAIL